MGGTPPPLGSSMHDALQRPQRYKNLLSESVVRVTSEVIGVGVRFVKERGGRAEGVLTLLCTYVNFSCLQPARGWRQVL